LLAGLIAPPAAPAAEPIFSMSVGAEYTTGGYGGDESVDETYLPVTATLDLERVSFRVTVPYLSVSAPELTYIDVPGGEPIIGEGPRVTTNGIGDVHASVTVYDVIVSSDGDFALDLTGKIKFGTADVEDGLGTGQEDFALQADLFRFFTKFTAIGSAGYALRGDPANVDLQDIFYATLGGSYGVNERVECGAFYDYRGASLEGSDAAHELTGWISTIAGARGRAEFYLMTGFGDSSPDWGAGISFARSF